jgi:hypothetical protein
MNELESPRKKRQKNQYVLRKFFRGDKSIEDQLFFIPPLLPIMQLLSNGELWHPRTKIYAGSRLTNVQKFNNCFNRREVPPFLRSGYNKKKMIETFQQFLKLRRRTILRDENGKYHISFTKTRDMYDIHHGDSSDTRKKKQQGRMALKAALKKRKDARLKDLEVLNDLEKFIDEYQGKWDIIYEMRDRFDFFLPQYPEKPANIDWIKFDENDNFEITITFEDVVPGEFFKTLNYSKQNTEDLIIKKKQNAGT